MGYLCGLEGVSLWPWRGSFLGEGGYFRGYFGARVRVLGSFGGSLFDFWGVWGFDPKKAFNYLAYIFLFFFVDGEMEADITGNDVVIITMKSIVKPKNRQ